MKNRGIPERNKLFASQRRISITQCVGDAEKMMDVDMGVDFRRGLFEKTGMSIAADGGDRNACRTHRSSPSKVIDSAATGYYYAAVSSMRPSPLRLRGASGAQRQHPHSAKLLLANYSMDGSSSDGCEALQACLVATVESQEEKEEDGEEEETEGEDDEEGQEEGVQRQGEGGERRGQARASVSRRAPQDLAGGLALLAFV